MIQRRRWRGQAYVEFIIVLPLLLLLVAGVIAFGQAFYAKLAVQAAAWSAGRHAIASLNATRGAQQGYLAARYTLTGFGLNPETAQVQVQSGAWGRATDVTVRVCYPIPRPPVPYGDRLVPTRVCAQQVMPTYRWKSRW
jgi:Flp pilus assembly protein TadG